MDNVLDFFEDSFSVFIFVIATTLLLNYTGSFKLLINATKKTLNDTYVVYESDNDELYNDTISYSELCTQLASPLSYDIEVVDQGTDIVFEADNYNYLLFDFTILPRSDYYKRSYVYENEKIKIVKYQVVN